MRGRRRGLRLRGRGGGAAPAGAPAPKCLALDELSNILKTSRKWDELLDAWAGWHAIAPPLRPMFERYVALGNKGAAEIGFPDVGALWRAGYDMPPRRSRPTPSGSGAS
nr:M2 family metallopeptidase [Sorangium cellulosum]